LIPCTPRNSFSTDHDFSFGKFLSPSFQDLLEHFPFFFAAPPVRDLCIPLHQERSSPDLPLTTHFYCNYLLIPPPPRASFFFKPVCLPTFLFSTTFCRPLTHLFSFVLTFGQALFELTEGAEKGLYEACYSRAFPLNRVPSFSFLSSQLGASPLPCDKMSPPLRALAVWFSANDAVLFETPSPFDPFAFGSQIVTPFVFPPSPSLPSSRTSPIFSPTLGG